MAAVCLAVGPSSSRLSPRTGGSLWMQLDSTWHCGPMDQSAFDSAGTERKISRKVTSNQHITYMDTEKHFDFARQKPYHEGFFNGSSSARTQKTLCRTLILKVLSEMNTAESKH